MTLLDRFRTQPRHKHPDPTVRLAYLEEIPLEERETVGSMAREDEDPRVRRAAVGKLMDPPALVAVAQADADEGVRAHAVAMLRDIALEAFEGIGEAESLDAVEALEILTEAKVIAQIAKAAPREIVALRALSRIGDSHTLGSIARHAVVEAARRGAFESLRESADHAEILAVAINSEYKDTALAAVDLITDRGELEQIAARGKNKRAVKRARGVIRDADERGAQEAAAATTARVETSRVESAVPVEPLTVAADVDAERARAERAARAEAERRREEQQAAERARLRAAAAEEARRESERRQIRLAELAEEGAAAAADTDLVSARKRLGFARREWKDLTAGIVVAPELASRLADAEAQVTARETAVQEADARARREALARLQQLLGRVEPLIARPDPSGVALRAADRALRDVRAALAAVPPLPSKHDYDEITRRLKALQAALTPKVQELREAEEWQRWANVGIQEQLCASMEALCAVEDPEEIARKVHELQQQWRQAADVPRAQADALWRRFKAAHDEIWARCAAYFAARAEARAANMASKRALCERAESLADSTSWIQTAEEIKRLQAEWKTIGPVSRGREKATWDRFRAACDRFFTRRHEDLARRKAMWAENLAKKDALCVKAEALADSSDWDQTAVEIRRLQAEWKTIGPVKKNRSEVIWQRFRGACDRFFTRYAQRYDVARAERIAAREAICAELEALARPEPAEGPALSGAEGPPAGDARALSGAQRPALSGAEGPALSGAQRPALSGAQRPALSGAEGPALSGAEGPALSGAEGPALSGAEAPALSGAEAPALSGAEGSPDRPADLIATVRTLRGRWQQEIAARGVDHERAQALDRRFAAAFARVVSRWPAVFGGTDLDPDANRKRMESSVRRIEDLASSLGGPAAAASGGAAALSTTTRLAAMLKERLAANTIGGKVDDDSRWRAAVEEVRQARANWARIGPVRDEARRALADRFERACRRITERAGEAGRLGGAGRTRPTSLTGS